MAKPCDSDQPTTLPLGTAFPSLVLMANTEGHTAVLAAPHTITELSDNSLQMRKLSLKEGEAVCPQVRKHIQGSAEDVGVRGA